MKPISILALNVKGLTNGIYLYQRRRAAKHFVEFSYT